MRECSGIISVVALWKAIEVAYAVEVARPAAENAEVVGDEAQARAQVAELRRDARLVEVAVVQLPELHAQCRCAGSTDQRT